MSKKSIRSVVVWLFILTLVLSGCTGGKKPPIGFKPGSPALYKVGDGSFYMRYAPRERLYLTIPPLQRRRNSPVRWK